MQAIETIPAAFIQTVLRERLADRSARLTDLWAEPIHSDGFSGNRLWRAHLAWTSGGPAGGSGSATWVVKRWLPGGRAERLLGMTRPLEAVAWEQGILAPSVLPPGVSVPILGARLDSGGAAAWIAMEDVASALSAYSREHPLPPAEAVARAKQALDGLARLHARWERPARQARLRRSSWLVPFERFLWYEAASYATVLGRARPVDGATGSTVSDEYRADVQALLAWLPAGDRRVLEELLCRREPLVAALGAFPRTLLHGDVDDRNIGLRRPRGKSTSDRDGDDVPELVLVDWESVTAGPPALDVAHLSSAFPAVCDPAQPLPEAAFSDELPEHYFERYRAHGGKLVDRDAWRRSCALARLACGMTQVAFFGAMMRQGVRPVVATLARQLEMMMPAARSLLAA